jgi:bacillithiol system protein YtxJ
MPITSWTRPEQVGELVEGRGTGLIFKHSSRCSISAAVRSDVERFAEKHPHVPVHLVLVIEDRPVSSEVAARLGIRHESPQAILVRDGAAVWSASHFDITAASLAEAWARTGSDTKAPGA